MLDWKQFKPMSKWVVVKADPRVKKTKGGIELPDMQLAAERVMEGTGRLLKVGPDVSKAVNFAVEPGMRICFRGFLKDAFQGFLREEDDCPIFLLRAEDIMAILDDEVQMGMLS